MGQLTDDAVFRESVILQEAFAEGVEKGIEKGIEEAVGRMLRRLFLLRSGREPTPAEQQALADRAHETTPEQFAEIVAWLQGDAFAAWLLGR